MPADTNTPVVQQTPASESGGAYIVQEAAGAGPQTPGQQEAFDKALAMLDAADDGGGRQDTPEAPPAAAQAQADGDVGEPAATPAAEDPFKQRFEQYRREYSKLDEERKAMRTQLQEYESLKKELAEARYNPNKLLEIGKVSQEDFTKLLLESGGEISPSMRVALEAKQRADSAEAQLNSMRTELQEKQEQHLVNNYRAEAQQFVRSTEEHEFLQTLGQDAATDLVMTEINNHYAQNLDPSTGQGPVLSYKEAADRVEQRIEQDMFSKYIKTRKMQAKFQEQQQAARVTSRQPRTLTGNMTPQTHAGPRTADERMAAAYKELTAAWQQ